MIVSPCISICKTDPETGFCYGCGRTDEEKLKWKSHETKDEWKVQNLKEIENNKLQNLLKEAEEESNKQEMNDQSKYLVDQKIEVLKSLN